MTSGDDLILAVPDQAVEWQKTGGDVQHRPGRLLGGAGIDNGHAAVVGHKGESVTAWGEAHSVNPASRVIQELSTDGVEGETLAPCAGGRALIHTLNESGEDSSVRVRRTSSQQNRVRVPCQRRDGAANWLLQVLGNPPVVLLLEVADGDHASSRPDGELLLRGRPADKGGGTVDTEQHQSRLPARWGAFPDVGVSVYGTGREQHVSQLRIGLTENLPWEQVTIRPPLGAISTLVTSFS